MRASIKAIIHKVRSKSCNISLSADISLDTLLAGNNYIGPRAFIANSTLGAYSYVGTGAEVVSTDINSYCSIAPRAVIGLQKHNLSFISTHPVFYYSNQAVSLPCISEAVPYQNIRTTIGSDVWVGHSAIIIAGVSLATGCVVGAGSVVTKDLEAYGIYAGNPARLIRYRFPEFQRSFLLESHWWEMELKDAASLFNTKKYNDLFG